MAGPYQDGFSPYAPGILWGRNDGGEGTGNSGSSEKAAREDHVHPLNVNINYIPIPVGGGINNVINVTGNGHPGSIGLSQTKTRAYALANHVHAYLFCDVLGRTGSTNTGPVRDGVRYAGFSIDSVVFSNNFPTGVKGKLAMESSVAEGFCGVANYPARADHSHPLNVPPSSDTASKTKEIGKENKNGESAYYARLDHEHMLGIPEVDKNSSGLTSGYLTINNNFVSKDAVSWAPDANSKKSITVKVACRVSSNNVMGGVFFRTLTFNSEGRLVSVSGENDAAVVVTDSEYGAS